MAQGETQPTKQSDHSGGLLNLIERIGNRLPDPVTLFVLGAVAVLIGSEIAAQANWTIENPVKKTNEQVTSLLSQEGLFWVWDTLVSNFSSFPPLGVVLVGMLGIGLAEHCGLIGALLKCMVLVTPRNIITPAMVFVGVMSSMAMDAGYIVLPPLAAAIFAKSGRSPLVGMAAVFAGVAAGFSANLVITGLDPLLQSFTQTAANLLTDDYVVDIRCNYYFMIASTILITFVGWFVTIKFVEPRFSQQDIGDQLAAYASIEADEPRNDTQELTRGEGKGLIAALIALVVTGGVILAMILMENGPLHGTMQPSPEKLPSFVLDRWVRVFVPILFVMFLIPGIAYGVAAGTIKSDKDVTAMMSKTMSGMGSYIVLAFFAAQFVAWFKHSNLGTMIALEGVRFLQSLNLPTQVLVIGIVLLSAVLNLFVGSASAKWALISTVFVPVFMGVGISPELTQAAYRVGDSVTNSITPLNPYVVIILVFMRKYMPQAGIGSLISLMLPYTIAFLLGWTVLLIIWMITGAPLGPGGATMFIEPI